MALFELKSKFRPAGDQPQAIEKLVRGLKDNNFFQTLLGVTGSGKTFTVANVISQFDKPVLVIAPNKALAAQLYREYKNFFPHNSVNYFVSYYDYYQPEAYIPTSDTYIEKEAMINQEIDRLRHQATSALLSRRDVIIVASVSCIYNLGLPSDYEKSCLYLNIGRPIVRQDLIRQLVKIQFERTSGALARAHFRARGDVFEIMPASANIAFRVELADQKIAGIYSIDVLTRKIIEPMKDILIFPPKHFVTSRPKIKKAIASIKAELKERLQFFNQQGLYLEAERLERRTKYDMEMLANLGYCHGIENYSRHLTGQLAGQPPETLLSYFPKINNQPDFLTIIDESHIAVPQINGMYQGDKSRKQILAQYGWRLPSALDNRPLRFDEFKQRVGRVVFTTATPGRFETENSSQVVEQVIRPTGLIDPPIEVRPVFSKPDNRSQIDDLLEEIDKIVAKSERVIVNTLTKKMAEDLNGFLIERKIKANYLHSDIKTLQRAQTLTDFRQGKFDVLVGVNLLREGLDLPEVSLVAILDADREGFLRSETSLMQTMGRAARHVSGKVILYADEITGSMKRAMSEVERRRAKQTAYNKKHGLRPVGISKDVEDLLDL